MTWLKFVNMFLLQWLFMRLSRCEEKTIQSFGLSHIGVMQDGSFQPAGTIKYKTYRWYALQFWVIPFTGWQGSFMHVFKSPTFIRITPKKVIDERTTY